ncbi:chorismate-pyruvate lyase [Mycobacterium tuberculosis]|uniref:chorismate--pyruvate lyase family protein n=1 Tax=Mycobacterium tuberculosis TaxID=1773 RepID=UPI0005E66F51|nr:chorismate pyruvate-lyase family protein [Mycobacterium tuberculosis]CKN58551.1 chorismate-pyruvate lyase [Mycobacterium tuberculosis]CKQ34843.1 chorismate-pyruvate lyase [Mycobacterium tuberculosis]CKQ47644.1 chorismate-pyruvate lyase [Mycobacterium tuberculosis]CKR93636.1 chorismate-pyruvate lyase [Mycobacterium tuberculosis]
MTECFLSDQEIRKLNRDLRILIAANGTLTRVLNIVADDEVIVQIVKQRIHDVSPKLSEFEQLGQVGVGRVLQRYIILKGRNSEHLFVAAESLIAIDRLPAAIITRLTQTNDPLGEVMAASHIETFKEEAKVWVGDLPGWLALHGYQNPQKRAVARRYRVISGGQPIMVVTEHFLRSVFRDAPHEEPDRWQFSNAITLAR